MTHPITWLSGLSLALLAGLPAHAEEKNPLTPGLWESNTTRMIVNGTDMLPQMAAAAARMKQQLASLPPAQRRQVEAMLLQQGTAPLSARLCISPEMAQREQTMLPKPEGATCEPAKTSRNGNRTSFELVCTQGGARLTAKGETVAMGDTIHTRMESQRSGNGKSPAQTTLVESQLKYLGKDCGGIRPLDEQARQWQQGAGKPAK